MPMKRGIDKATEAVVQAIRSLAAPVKGRRDIEQIATVSANDAEIGRLVAKAMDRVGTDGVITVEEGKGLRLEVEYTEGMQFDRGYISSYFVTDQQRMEAARPKNQRRCRSAAHAGARPPDGQKGPGDHRRRC